MPSDVQVYGADWCGLTRGVRAYLTTLHLEYEYFNVDNDPHAEEFALAVSDGRRRFPVVVVNDCIVTGARIPELQRVLDDHALRPLVSTARPTENRPRRSRRLRDE